jgi:hypothetical protein
MTEKEQNYTKKELKSLLREQRERYQILLGQVHPIQTGVRIDKPNLKIQHFDGREIVLQRENGGKATFFLINDKETFITDKYRHVIITPQIFDKIWFMFTKKPRNTTKNDKKGN